MMPTTYYAIKDGTGHPQIWVKSIDKVNGTYTETTLVNDVLEYTSDTAAQSDATYLSNLVGIEKFHIAASPKPH